MSTETAPKDRLLQAARTLLHRGADGGEPVERNDVGYNRIDYYLVRALLQAIDRNGQVRATQLASLMATLRKYRRQLEEIGMLDVLDTLPSQVVTLPVDEANTPGQIIPHRPVPEWEDAYRALARPDPPLFDGPMPGYSVNSTFEPPPPAPEDEGPSPDDWLSELDEPLASATPTIPPMRDVLGPEGVIAKRLPGYEHREPQIEAAEAIRQAILDKQHAIVEAGTGVGKCVHGDMLVTLADGTRRTVASLVGQAPAIASLDANLSILPRASKVVFASGAKEVFRLTTRLGHTLVASADHPLLTVDGWRRLGELDPGASIAAARQVSAEGSQPLPAAEVRYLAYMLADGSCSNPRSLSYTKADPETVDDWKAAVAELGNAYATTLEAKHRYGIHRETRKGRQKCGGVAVLERHGIAGKKSSEKAIPDAIFALPRDQLALFLGRLFTGDGCVEGRGVVSYSSGSEQLVEQVQHLLLRFGIVAKKRRHDGLYNGRSFPAWHLEITGAEQTRAFGEEIGPYLIGPKARRLQAVLSGLTTSPNPNVDLIPPSAWQQVDAACQRAGKSLNDVRTAAGVASDRTRGISRAKLAFIGAYLNAPELQRLALSDIYWDRILSIEPVGVAETYDITMWGDPNFLANDLVVHNSLAYLVPAIYSGRKAIVATSGKALQDQLANKDLPFLADVLPVPFTFSVLKGRSNYLCLRDYDEEKGKQEGLFGEKSAEFAELEAWLADTKTGDLEEMATPISPELRQHVTCDADECDGDKCRLFAACHYYRAKARAEQAQVVVVNHTLLALDCAIRLNSDGFASVLPDRELVICDEAHSLEETFTRAFEVELSSAGLERLLRDRLLNACRVDPSLAARALVASEDFFEALGSTNPNQYVTVWGVAQPTPRRIHDLAEALALCLTSVKLALGKGNPYSAGSPDSKRVEALQKRLADRAELLGGILVPNPTDIVYVERRQSRRGKPITALKRCPISVAEQLRESLFEKWPTICCSATLATGSGDAAFDYFRKRVGLDGGSGLGLPAATELQVGSPFDYRSHALLYLPGAGALFDPTRYYHDGSVEYFDRLAREIESLLLASDGRAFCLFTSNKALDEVHRRIAHRLKWQVLRQGDLPRGELVKRFKADGHAVLFGLRSFWEGVDVQGDALSLVTVDKLPFQPPDDPLYAARCEAVNRARNDKWAWFRELALPEATIMLKQGFGRLIRTKSDVGVVALLDGRLTTKGYGTGVVRALPPATPVRSLAEVQTFFKTKEVPYRQDKLF